MRLVNCPRIGDANSDSTEHEKQMKRNYVQFGMGSYVRWHCSIMKYNSWKPLCIGNELTINCYNIGRGILTLPPVVLHYKFISTLFRRFTSSSAFCSSLSIILFLIQIVLLVGGLLLSNSCFSDVEWPHHFVQIWFGTSKWFGNFWTTPPKFDLATLDVHFWSSKFWTTMIWQLWTTILVVQNLIWQLWTTNHGRPNDLAGLPKPSKLWHQRSGCCTNLLLPGNVAEGWLWAVSYTHLTLPTKA